MIALVSPRIAALRHKLRQAEHAGQYFSADDVAGFIQELAAIGRDVKALEDAVAGQRRAAAREPTLPPPPSPTAVRSRVLPAPAPNLIGTLVFVPAGAQLGGTA